MERRKEGLAQEEEARMNQVKEYSAPRLTVHGSVEEITRTGGAAATTDTVFTHSQ